MHSVLKEEDNRHGSINTYELSIDEATDIYYNSETANMIEEGVADLHCRSDKYLAEEIWKEYQEIR